MDSLQGSDTARAALRVAAESFRGAIVTLRKKLLKSWVWLRGKKLPSVAAYIAYWSQTMSFHRCASTMLP